MSVKIMSRVWDYSQAKHAELLIMLALADWSNDNGKSYPSIPKLSRKARLTERQTRRSLAVLEKLGELRRQRSNGGRNRVNQYFITIPENPDRNTLTEIQGKDYPEKNDQETLVKLSGAYIRHRTVTNSARHPKRTKSPNPAVNELKDFWASEYQKLCGVAYSFNHNVDGNHFKELLTTFDASLIKHRIVNFFDLDDEWIQTVGGYTVGVFRKRINTLNSVGRRSRSTQQQELPA